MKRKMSLRKIDVTSGLLTKIATKEVYARWEIAKRKRVLRAELEPLDEAREIPEDIKDYNNRQLKIYQTYGKIIGGGSFRIEKENIDTVNDKISELDKEFAKALEEDRKRMKDIERLLDKEVEFEIEPIDYEWIGDSLDSNDVEILMELEMVNDPKPKDDEKEDATPTPKKKKGK